MALYFLYDRYKNKMINLVKHKWGLDSEVGEGIYDDAAAYALTNIANGSFKGNSNYETYLSRIVHNKTMDEMRSLYTGKDKEKKKSIVFSTDQSELGGIDTRLPSESPEVIFAGKDLIENVKSIMNSMSEKCRNILGLKGDGLGPTEIAQQLTKAISTIKNGTGACQKKLHALLRKNVELYSHLSKFYDATKYAE